MKHHMIPRAVIALGGNALGNTPEEQREKVRKAVKPLIELIKLGNEIIISHGNGPQVGMINLAFEEASQTNDKVVRFDLPECIAMSQGYIGYHLQNALQAEIYKQKRNWFVASVITQIEVDKDDEAFRNPTKPIGSFYSEEEAINMMRKDSSLVMRKDAKRGYRKVVPSPKPIRIVEKESVVSMLDNEFIVVTCGGGGIPVIRKEDGSYEGVQAVIDKDYASAKLAEAVDAEYLFILTAVERVCLNYGTSQQEGIEKMSVTQAEQYIAEGHFSKGSMLPKVQAAVNYVKGDPERRAVIASLEKAAQAIKGESGTVIYNAGK